MADYVPHWTERYDEDPKGAPGSVISLPGGRLFWHDIEGDPVRIDQGTESSYNLGIAGVAEAQRDQGIVQNGDIWIINGKSYQFFDYGAEGCEWRQVENTMPQAPVELLPPTIQGGESEGTPTQLRFDLFIES